MQKQMSRNAISNKGFRAEYFYNIVWCDFARKVIFYCPAANSWQMLAEPLGSAKPQFKITAVSSLSGV